MVGIFTGAGTGFERGSGRVLDGAGLLGQAALGRSGEQVMLNAANGNLLVSQKDEFLAGRGPDAAISRTYNSLGDLSDDNGDNWRQSTDRRIYGLTGDYNSIGSTVKRVGADGSVMTYRYTGAAYVTTDGAGAYDKLTWSGSVWTWADGDSQTTETYGYSYNSFSFITVQRDTSGNSLTFKYTDGRLTDLVTANGERIRYLWAGNRIAEIQTSFDSAGAARTATRTRYDYDGLGRLSSVAVDLSPEDNNISDGNRYVTTYTYHGNSRLISSIMQTDGSRIDIGYDGDGRVTTMAQVADSQTSRVTSIVYGPDYTSITDPNGSVTRLDYSSGDFASKFYSGNNVVLEPATINGIAATKFTVRNAGGQAELFEDFSVAAGDTISFGLTMQAAGNITTQDIGLHSDQTGWGVSSISTARIVSGPGRIEQITGGLWRVVDLSPNLATRVEIMRTYDQSGSGGAYFYVDKAGGFRAGSSLIAGEKMLLRSATASTFDRIDATAWSATNLNRDSATDIDGAAAYSYSVKTAGTNAHLQKNFAVKAGETHSFVMTLQAVGAYKLHHLGLGGSVSSWGPDALSSARILSGPGTLTQEAGGYSVISGLSNSQPTKIVVTRTFERDETAFARLFVALAENEPAGAAVIVSGTAINVTRWSATNLIREVAPSIDGAAAYRYSIKTAGTNAHLERAFSVKTSETYSLVTTLQAVGASNSHHLGLGGSLSSWGADALSSARILSGPGTLTRQAGGYYSIEGLSDTRPTTVALTRTFDRDENAFAKLFVALATDEPAGAAVIVSGTNVLRQIVEPANAGQLLKITAPPAVTGAAQQVTQFTYGSKGDLLTIIDPSGSTTAFTYDADGNALTTSDRLGKTVTRTYDSRNQLRRETAMGVSADAEASFSTNYVYDVFSRLRYTVSGEGRVTQYAYAATGELTRTEQYTGAVFTTSGAPTEAGMNSWVSGLSDKSARQIVMTEYDARGAVLKTTRFGAADANGNPVTSNGYEQTFYSYDQSGQLLHRRTNSLNQEHFVYDGLGRVIASTDVRGGTTSFRFADTAQQTVVTLAAGLIRTSTYNQAGDLLSATESGSNITAGTAIYQYDRLGRVRITTDATSYKNYVVYDAVGRKVGDVNQLGQLTEFKYDNRGRLVASVIWGAALSSTKMAMLADPLSNVGIASLRPNADVKDLWNWTVYDKEGRVLQRIDGAGSTVVYAYDASGRPTKTTEYYNPLISSLETFRAAAPTSVKTPAASAARDVVTRTFYDRDGAVIGALDGEGYLSRVRYDAAGNKVEETAFATQVPTSSRASATLTQLVTAVGDSAADRIARYIYDGQGLLQFQLDALNNITEFVYASSALGDATGVVRQAIAYAHPLGPQTSYTASAVRAALTAVDARANPSNRQSFAVYDTRGNLAYGIDASGAVVSYAYDPAGNLTKTVRYKTSYAASSPPSQQTMDAWAQAAGSDAENRVTRNYHSARNGELRFTIDGLGYVTRIDHDAESRAIAVVRFDAAMAGVTDATTISGVEAWATGSAVVTTTAYDQAGRVLETRDGNGTATRTFYNVNGTVQYTLSAFDTTDVVRTQYGYNGAGRVISRSEDYNRIEAVTRFTFDGLGNLISELAPDAVSLSTYMYDRSGNRLSRTNAVNGVVRYEYNAFGEEVRLIDERGNSTYTYRDKIGRKKTVRDAEGYVTETGFNTFGDIETVTQRYNRATNAAEIAALPAVVTDSRDATTRYGYDKLGRMVLVFDAENASESTGYNVFGEVSEVRNKVGGIKTYTYDTQGQLFREYTDVPYYDSDGDIPVNSDGIQATAGYYTHTYAYDSRGNVKSDLEDNSAGFTAHSTYYTYDAADRVIRKKSGTIQVYLPGSVTTLQPVESYEYDRRGNVVEITDANGRSTILYYDGLDRKVAEVDAAGAYSTFSYDKNSALSRKRTYATRTDKSTVSPEYRPAVSGEYRETSYINDALGRLQSTSVAGVRTGGWNGSAFVTSVTTATEALRYDAAGNVVRTTDANGASVYAYYDALGRKVAEVDQEGFLTEWSLDNEGNSTSERRYAQRVSGATETMRPAGTAHSDDRITDFSYDRNARRLTETRRDVEAWLVDLTTGSLSAANGDATVRYTYNALGQVTSKQEATGDRTLYQYDKAGRLTIEVREDLRPNQDDEAIPTITYFYDALGSLVRTVESGGRVTKNDYDADGRLTKTTDATGAARSYYYDRAGRRMGESYTRYTSSNAAKKEGMTYRYDAMGRLTYQGLATWTSTSWIATGDETQIAYNAFGDVVSRSINGVVQEQFAYDGAGRLWRSTTGDGTWRYFLYDAAGRQTLVLESDGETDVQNKTLDEVLAIATNNGATSVGGARTGVTATMTYYDARGQNRFTISPQRQLSAGSGAVMLIGERSYTAFGEIASETGAGGTTYHAYNRMGRAIMVTGPQVAVTGEDGQSVQQSPVEWRYHDISGRLVGSRDANGTLATRALAPGTGYGASEALVLGEYHADGGRVSFQYDAAGNLVRRRNEIGRATSMTYDALGRMLSTSFADSTEVQHGYAYDILGRQIRHTQAGRAAGDAETTDFDIAGRVGQTRAFGGDVTKTAYAWDAAISAGLGAAGGWRETTTFQNGRTAVEAADAFGHVLSRTDMGGAVSTTAYDQAGRVATVVGPTSGYDQDGRLVTNLATETQTFGWLNTGLLGAQTSDLGTPGQVRATATFGYDMAGNRTSERLVRDGQSWQDARAGYDLLGRMTSWSEAGSAVTPAASTAWSYDAVGNIRRTLTQRPLIGGDGSAVGTQGEDLSYRFDALGRVVSDGAGVRYTYDAGGQRRTATSTVTLSAQVWREQWNASHTDTVSRLVTLSYEGERRETFAWRDDGQLASVAIVTTGYEDDGNGPLVSNGVFDTAAGSSAFGYDAAGRQVGQVDRDASGAAVYDRQEVLDARGLASRETVHQRQGGEVVTTVTTSDYGTGSGYALGEVVGSVTTTARGGVSQGSASTTNVHVWGAGAQLASSSVTQANQAPATTDYAYGPGGRLDGVSIRDGRPRTVTILSDLNGQALRRDEADGTAAQGDPHDLWYRFGGREIGHAGVVAGRPGSFAASIAARGAAPATGAFAQAGLRHGAAFVEGVDPITSYEQGADGGRYTVQAGDVATGSAQAALAGIAGRLWGDAGLWYRLAQANGLAGGAALAIGRVLTVPAGVVGSAYHAGMMRGFDPADALGDVSPVTPSPAGKAARRTKCGAFGTVLLVAVAVAVTIATGGAAAAALAPASGAALSAGALAGIGVGAGIAGSVASQGLGLATGLQDGFRWKSVALAGIAGGIGGGLGAASLGRGALGAVARGALGNALTQGVAVASGLQGRFDWAGVAVGGAVGGVAGAAGRGLARAGADRFAAGLGAGMAGAVAGGAARSLLTGTSFGDTVLATLPDAIGASLGNAVGERLAYGGRAYGGRIWSADGDIGDAGGGSAGVGTVALPRPGESETFGRGGSGGSGRGPSPAAGGAARDIVEERVEEIVVTARRDTRYAIRYEDAAGNFDAIHADAMAQGLDHSQENQLFRATALTDRILSPFRSGFSFVLDAAPFVGTAKGATQVYTGTDLVTGQPLNRLVEAGTLLLGALPFGKIAGKVGAGVLGRAAENAGARFGGAYATSGDLIQSIATRADNWGIRSGLGNGPVTGTAKHGYADRLLTRYQNMFGSKGLATEARYVGGTPWREGRPLTGSIRLDVVEGPLASPTRIWDYKFGNATLYQSRITQIQNGIPNGSNVTILMVKP